jgi:steroid 5-alpha reductase family enzyme
MTIMMTWLWLGAVMVIVMTLGWQWQRRHANAGIVDVLWSVGIGLAAMLMAVFGNGAPLPRTLLALLGGAWSLRLALHLWRRVRGEAEDGRYRHLRVHWRHSQAKFFAFFMAQAALVVLFALPLAAVATNPVAWPTVWTVLAVVVWVLSVALEAVADRQLARFRADPVNRGKTCRAGLWRYSRHPNYFFEWMHWFTYVALAVGSPLNWLAWGGPVMMYVFLRWVSGVPYTEAQALRTRGEDYRAYQRSTPMLFPWFPRHDSVRRSV